MENTQLINTPWDLLLLAAVVGGAGIVIFVLANLIMKATGDDIGAHVRESRRYRDMGALEQMTAFYSNPRNIPVALGIGGIILVFGSICMAAGGLLWFLTQARSGTQTNASSLWLNFGKVVVTAAAAGDQNTLLDELSLCRVTDAEVFVQEVVRTNPDVEWKRNDSTLSDSQARQAMSEDVKLFSESYSDLFDAQLACVTPARLALLKDVELYSVIVWVKKRHRFHGIKIDRVWKTGNQLKVVEWVSLSGYFLDPTHGTVVKKRAKLVCDSVDDCSHPEEIEYEYQAVR